jgi:hypothetical protein
MAFSFKKREFFVTEVTIPVPNEKGGLDNNTFKAHFKPATNSELKELREGEDIATVRKQLLGWEMVDEETRQPVPYSEEAREAVLEVAAAPYHIALAFYRASSGAKAKNS